MKSFYINFYEPWCEIVLVLKNKAFRDTESGTFLMPQQQISKGELGHFCEKQVCCVMEMLLYSGPLFHVIILLLSSCVFCLV